MHQCKNHPERPARSKRILLCGSCYNKDLFAKNPEAKRKANACSQRWRDEHPDIKAYRKDKYWTDKADPKKREKRLKTQLKGNRRRKYEKYGITEEMYDTLALEGCRICASTAKLHMDHCHSTGKFRGLLCASCNLGIGHFQYGQATGRHQVFGHI